MSLFGLNFVILLFSIGTVKANLALESYPSENVFIIPKKFYLCEDTKPAIPFVINLRNINDNGDKVGDVEVDIDVDFNENWEMVGAIEKWNNGDWDEGFYTIRDRLCPLIFKYTQKPWDNFREQIVPSIEEKCYIKPGLYNLTDFTMKTTDLNFPTFVLGTYKISIRLYDGEHEEIICQVAELEIQKK